jgi:intracellular septation protein
MTMLYDFIPVLLFFIAFKWYGIYVATVVGIVMTGLQVIITRLWKKRFDKQQVVTFAVFLIFGSMTLYFHNPIFVKWKPSVIFWLFSIVFLLSQFIDKKPFIQRMLGTALDEKGELPRKIWLRLNWAWALFFAIMGTINIFVAYSYSTETWVNFKLYGILGLGLAFGFLQAIWLARYTTTRSSGK